MIDINENSVTTSGPNIIWLDASSFNKLKDKLEEIPSSQEKTWWKLKTPLTK